MTWAEWQAAGRDRHSVVADPRCRDPAHADFSLRPDSPALRLGFRPFDLSRAGLYGPREWVERPRFIKRAAFKLAEAAPPAPITDDLEATSVGQPPRLAQVYGRTERSSILVSDEQAAAGHHSLKFTDAAGLEATWQPHMAYTPSYARGAARIAFDVRLEQGAKLVMQGRDWRKSPFDIGPTVILTAGGDLKVGEKVVGETPVGKWMHVEVTCPLGGARSHTWSAIITTPDRAPMKLADLPLGTPGFQWLTWVGFIADADAAAVSYLDNVRIEPLKAP
jgi:hypothetical protein